MKPQEARDLMDAYLSIYETASPQRTPSGGTVPSGTQRDPKLRATRSTSPEDRLKKENEKNFKTGPIEETAMPSKPNSGYGRPKPDKYPGPRSEGRPRPVGGPDIRKPMPPLGGNVRKESVDEVSEGALNLLKRGVKAVLGPADQSPKAEAERMGARRPQNAQQREVGKRTAEVLKKEDVDLFDIVGAYLIDEGYADTEEAAFAIMANMSEGWRESIVEQLDEGLVSTVQNLLGLARDRDRKVSDKTPMGQAVTGLQRRRQATDAAMRQLRGQ